MDDNGNEISNGFDLNVFSTVHRFIHVTKIKLFGADYFYNVIVPLVDKDFSVTGLSDSRSLTLGDVTIERTGLA